MVFISRFSVRPTIPSRVLLCPPNLPRARLLPAAPPDHHPQCQISDPFQHTLLHITIRATTPIRTGTHDTIHIVYRRQHLDMFTTGMRYLNLDHGRYLLRVRTCPVRSGQFPSLPLLVIHTLLLPTNQHKVIAAERTLRGTLPHLWVSISRHLNRSNKSVQTKGTHTRDVRDGKRHCV